MDLNSRQIMNPEENIYENLSPPAKNEQKKLRVEKMTSIIESYQK